MPTMMLIVWSKVKTMLVSTILHLDMSYGDVRIKLLGTVNYVLLSRIEVSMCLGV